MCVCVCVRERERERGGGGELSSLAVAFEYQLTYAVNRKHSNIIKSNLEMMARFDTLIKYPHEHILKGASRNIKHNFSRSLIFWLRIYSIFVVEYIFMKWSLKHIIYKTLSRLVTYSRIWRKQCHYTYLSQKDTCDIFVSSQQFKNLDN